MPTDDQREIARKRVKARRDFWSMLAVFVVVAIVLVAIWFLTTGGSGYFWPVWPLVGLGIATLFSALNAFGITNRHVTEADVDAEVDRMNRGR